MKQKYIYITVLALAIGSYFSPALTAEQHPADELRERLLRLKQFSANFTHKVINKQGNIIQNSAGFFIIKQPSKLFWQVDKPEKEQFISNEQTLWHYSPFLEQVTIIDLSNVTYNSSFLPLMQGIADVYKQYKITYLNNEYQLQHRKQPINKISIAFNDQGYPAKLTIAETNDYYSNYQFTKFNVKVVDDALFNFSPPAGVAIDDQRQ